MPPHSLRIIRLEGQTAYSEVWRLQQQVHTEVLLGGDDTLILTEHQPVITIGRAGGEDHFLTDPDQLKELGYDVEFTNRGGDITYHGPGQLVCYPIFDLNRHYRDVHRFLRELEEVGIRLLEGFNVDGYRVPGRTGVWTEKGKIAAIGVHIKKWITMHGIAFNVSGGLEGFRHIIPCGIADEGVTSLEKLISTELTILDLMDIFVQLFSEIFGFTDSHIVNDIKLRDYSYATSEN